MRGDPFHGEARPSLSPDQSDQGVLRVVQRDVQVLRAEGAGGPRVCAAEEGCAFGVPDGVGGKLGGAP